MSHDSQRLASIAPLPGLQWLDRCNAFRPTAKEEHSMVISSAVVKRADRTSEDVRIPDHELVCRPARPGPDRTLLLLFPGFVAGPARPRVHATGRAW
jgi:hypothetical protein